MAPECTDSHDIVKKNCPEIKTRRESRATLHGGMLAEWARNALKYAGLNQSEAARRLTTEVGWEVNRSAMSMLLKGQRVFRAEEMVALSRLTGYALPQTVPPTEVDPLTRAAIEAAISECLGDVSLGQALARVVCAALEHPQQLAGSPPEAVMALVVRTAIRQKLSEVQYERGAISKPRSASGQQKPRNPAQRKPRASDERSA